MNGTSNNTELTTTAFFINYVDYIIRVYAFIVYMVYFGIYLGKSDLRTRSYLFLNNVNLIGFIYVIHYTFYLGTRTPNFDDDTLNDVFCTLSEYLWMWLKLTRSLALLLLALYRYLGVFHLKAFKRFNDSMLMLVGVIMGSWLMSIILCVILKYSLRTTYSNWFCTDGASSSLANSIVYCAISLMVFELFPTGIILFLYFKIFAKLAKLKKSLSLGNKSQSKRTNEQEPTSNRIFPISIPIPIRSIVESSETKKNKAEALSNNKKQNRLSTQLLIINILTVFGTILMGLIDFQVVITIHPALVFLDTLLEQVRPMLRSFLIFSQSFIPIVSIVFSSFVFKHNILKDFIQMVICKRLKNLNN